VRSSAQVAAKPGANSSAAAAGDAAP